MRLKQAVPFLTLISLAGCGFLGGEDETNTNPPVITNFTASPSVVAMAGETVTLNWVVEGPVTGLEISEGVGQVSGTSEVVTPTVTTTYRLTARNSAGSSSKSATVTVTDTTTPPPVEPPPGDTDVTDPTGTFGVSEDLTDTPLNDAGGNITSPDDDRVLKLEAGDTFYAHVNYSDPSGIAGIIIRLNNQNPPGLYGDLVRGQDVGGFTLVGPVRNCNLGALPTSVNCIFEIKVGDDVENIDQLPDSANEFAYVFRTFVTDGASNQSTALPRGYVTVGETNGAPTPPTPAPEPDDNEAPTADFEVSADGTSGLSFNFDASDSSDPDGDDLLYAWDFGDGEEATGVEVSHTYGDADTYEVELTVTDPDGKSDSKTGEVEAGPLEE